MLNVENILQSLIRLLFKNCHHATVGQYNASWHSPPIQPYIWIEDNGQWAWTWTLWLWGKNCRLCLPGRWPKSLSAKSGVGNISHFWWFALFSVLYLLICNFGCFVDRPRVLSTSPSVWKSMDHTVYVSWRRGKRIQINGNVTSRFISEIWKSIWLRPF